MQSTKIGKNEVWYENSDEFNELKREIWTNHVYYLEGLENVERIVDLGAHIGLSSIYLANVYPEARIEAYEPDPANFRLLEKNIIENQLKQIEIFQMAVSGKTGEITLQAPRYEDEWRSGVGIIEKGWRGVLHTEPIRVPARSINEIIGGGVDLIKMDIEGLEYEVVEAMELKNVRNMIIEVHPREGKRVGAIEKKITSNNFRLERRDNKDKYGSGLIMYYAFKE